MAGTSSWIRGSHLGAHAAGRHVGDDHGFGVATQRVLRLHCVGWVRRGAGGRRSAPRPGLSLPMSWEEHAAHTLQKPSSGSMQTPRPGRTLKSSQAPTCSRNVSRLSRYGTEGRRVGHGRGPSEICNKQTTGTVIQHKPSTKPVGTRPCNPAPASRATLHAAFMLTVHVHRALFALRLLAADQLVDDPASRKARDCSTCKRVCHETHKTRSDPGWTGTTKASRACHFNTVVTCRAS